MAHGKNGTILENPIKRKNEQREPVGPTTYFTYHKNGTKESESDLLKDKLHGNFKKWNPAGKILMEGQFKNGLKDGQWKLFLSAGTKTVIFEKKEKLKIPSSNLLITHKIILRDDTL